MKHLTLTAIALFVAVVEVAAIAQTMAPTETPAASSPRRQSGTVGATPDAAPTPNLPDAPTPREQPAASATTATTPSTAAPAGSTPAPAASASTEERQETHAPHNRRQASGRVTEADGHSAPLPVRADRN